MTEIYQFNRPIFLTKKGHCDTVIMSAEMLSKYELTDDACFKEFLQTRDSGVMLCGFCGK